LENNVAGSEMKEKTLLQGRTCRQKEYWTLQLKQEVKHFMTASLW